MEPDSEGQRVASYLSPYGPEPPSQELLVQTLDLPRAELADIMGVTALETRIRTRHR